MSRPGAMDSSAIWGSRPRSGQYAPRCPFACAEYRVDDRHRCPCCGCAPGPELTAWPSRARSSKARSLKVATGRLYPASRTASVSARRFSRSALVQACRANHGLEDHAADGGRALAHRMNSDWIALQFARASGPSILSTAISAASRRWCGTTSRKACCRATTARSGEVRGSDSGHQPARRIQRGRAGRSRRWPRAGWGRGSPDLSTGSTRSAGAHPGPPPSAR